MSSRNHYAKVFFDSRWRSAGDHNSFTIELPNDLDTTRTASVYLASCSFSNTFKSVEAGVNDRLYVLRRPSGGGTKTAWYVPIAAYQYDGTGLASAVSRALKSAPGSSAYLGDLRRRLGTMVLTADNGDQLQFPTERELRSTSWRSVNWDPYAASQYAYDAMEPHEPQPDPLPAFAEQPAAEHD
jgi:hypothetical protein